MGLSVFTGATVKAFFPVSAFTGATVCFHWGNRVLSLGQPCFRFSMVRWHLVQAADVDTLGDLPAHEILDGMRDRRVGVVLRELPLARLLRCLEAESALLGALDETPVLQNAKHPERGMLTDVNRRFGLTHRIRDAAIVAAVVSLGDFEVEGARGGGKAFPRYRVEQPVTELYVTL